MSKVKTQINGVKKGTIHIKKHLLSLIFKELPDVKIKTGTTNTRKVDKVDEVTVHREGSATVFRRLTNCSTSVKMREMKIGKF